MIRAQFADGAFLQATDNQWHDGLCRWGPIKAFTLRGIKESPPYMHDGRLLTLEDTVEFFNLISELGSQEKADLVAFLRTS